MTIEQNIFGKSLPDSTKLESYGFIRDGNNWTYQRLFMDNQFCATIKIDTTGKIVGTVLDVAANEPYLPLRVEDGIGGYSQKVRTEYQNILRDIKNCCCSENTFGAPQTNRLIEFIAQNYGHHPDFPWEKYNIGVFKNPDSQKWYALIMEIDQNKLDKNQSGKIEVVNLKISPDKIPLLLEQNGFYPAYHMNKKNWITLTLDDTIKDKILFSLLGESHAFTIRNNKLRRRNRY